MSNGRDICDRLRELRRQVAEKYGLEYNPTECHHEGDCAGTCPACDIELFKLQSQLEAKGIKDIDVRLFLPEDETNDFEIDEDATPGIPYDINMINQTENPEEQDRDGETLMGDVMPPTETPELITLCYVAGLQFHDIEEVWPELSVGTRLALVRDRNNKYDHNAVAVALESDYDGDPDNFDFDFILGYIPRRDNEEIAGWLDEGCELYGEIKELNEHVHYSRRILIGVYINTVEPEEEERERHREPSKIFRALSLTDKAFRETSDAIYENGYACFRWGARFKPDEDTLPIKGERIVLMCRGNKSTTMYLTYVLARGDEADAYIKNCDERYDVSNREPFILSNIAGPVTVPNWALEFLSTEYVNDEKPEKFLTYEATDTFTMIFRD